MNGLFERETLLLAGEVLLKLGLAVILGLLIGYERERHGRPAGIRTHMLIILGTTMMCEAGRHFGGGDPGRVAAQVVAGIGFLGAGAIVKLGAEIKGLTSAASIWAMAGLGLAIAAGGAFIWVAVASTVLILITLTWVDNLERVLVPHAHPETVHVRLASQSDLPPVLEALRSAGLSVAHVESVALDGVGEWRIQVRGGTDQALSLCSGVAGVQSAWKSD